MPAITPLVVTKRSDTGAALTQAQFDGNLENIQQTVNSILSLLELAVNPDGSLRDGVVGVNQISNAIITLAKLAAFAADDYGKFLRANKTTGVIEAVKIANDKLYDSTAVASSGVQSALSLGEFTFTDIPAGDVMVWVKLHAQRTSGANGGTITLKHGDNIIDQTPTHVLDNGTQWTGFSMFGRISDFAGGSLVLDLEFETSEADSEVVFGVDGENRFGRAVQILAGL